MDQRPVVKWFIDKNSKIPLYLQLKGLITHYISTGVLNENQRLPTVKQMAKELGINFETVRKAYKDLEKEGLLSAQRGTGTFASGHTPGNLINTPLYSEVQPMDLLRISIEKIVKKGIVAAEIRTLMENTLNEVLLQNSKQLLLFTECNRLQIREISEVLKNDLKLNVQPVLLNELRLHVEQLRRDKVKLLAVVTTGFHVNEVRHMLSDLPINVDFVITNMSTSTRRTISSMDKKVRFGLICRDPVQMHFFKDLVKEELAIETEMPSCVISEQSKVQELMRSVDVLLVSPPVYDEVKAMASPDAKIFNVLDRVDPVSLSVLRQRLLQLP
jgi:DNA-binding transcriptional regulator YhcF (GntR family)